MSNQSSSNNHPVTSVRGGSSTTSTPANTGIAPSKSHGAEQTRDSSYPPTSTEALKGTPRTDNLADKLSNAGTATGAFAADKANDVVEAGSTAAKSAASTTHKATHKAEGLGSKLISGVAGLFTGQPRMTSNTEQAAHAAKDAMGTGNRNESITSQVQSKMGDAFGTGGKGSATGRRLSTGRAMAIDFEEDYKLESNPGEDRMPLGMRGADEYRK